MMKKDARLIKNIRQVLDRSLDELDASTLSRLTQARHKALEKAGRRRVPWYCWGSLPVAAVLAVIVMLNWPSSQQLVVPTPQIDDLNILTAVEPLEFYQEEIEFYEWLADELAMGKELSDGSPSVAAPVAVISAGRAGRTAATAESRATRLSGGV